MKIEWKIDNEYRNKSLSNAKRHRISLHTSTYKINERRKKNTKLVHNFLYVVYVYVCYGFFCWRCVGIWINFLFHWYRAWHARIMQVKVYPPPPHREKKSKERDEVRLAF